jgi:hypothetical protein
MYERREGDFHEETLQKTGGLRPFGLTFWDYRYRGTLRDLYVRLHDSSGNAMGGSTNFYGSSDSQYVKLLVTSGAVYYLRVYPAGSNSGTYKIAFNTSTTPPG